MSNAHPSSQEMAAMGWAAVEKVGEMHEGTGFEGTMEELSE